MPSLPTPGYFVGVPTYLYGPVPSPGVPSTLFVDLLNAQTVAGAKTFTSAIGMNQGAINSLNIQATDVASTPAAFVQNAFASGPATLATRWLHQWNNNGNPRAYLTRDGMFISGVGLASGAPTFTNRSSGVRYVVLSNVGAASVDWAMGVETDWLWLSASTNVTTQGLKIYGGTTELARFAGGGAGGGLLLQQVGAGVAIREGTNAKQGVATLVAGTVTVANTSITANSRIQLTGQDNNATGALRVSARVVGTSFTITSSDAGATGVVAYFITEPS